MLVRQEPLHAGQGQHRRHERRRDVAFQQPVAIFAEHRGHPDRIVHRKSDEPPEQEVVVELLHQLPLRADGVEGLQQQRAQQLLGRDRGAAVLGVEFGEPRVECGQGVVGQRADHAQRVGLGDPALRSDITEKAVASFVKTAHSARPKGVDHMRYRIRYTRAGTRPFSAAC